MARPIHGVPSAQSTGAELSGEAQQIIDALESTHWSRSDAAQLLDISRTTLWRKMREYQIEH